MSWFSGPRRSRSEWGSPSAEAVVVDEPFSVYLRQDVSNRQHGFEQRIMDCSLCRSPRTQNPASFTEKEVIQHVEHLARGSVDAVNRKSYDIYSKEWNYLSSSLLIEFAHPSYRGPQRMPLIAYLDLLQQNTERWPQYKATILDQSTTVNEEMNEAVVFENAEVEGAPPGVITKLVIVLDFKLRAAPRVGEEPWRCVSLRSAIGI